MILFLGDLSCRYGLVNHAVDAAEHQFDQTVSAVIQLGDFGIFKDPLTAFFNNRSELPFKRPVYFIDGNHEDFLFFNSLTRSFKHHFTYLPRGCVRKLAGFNFLCLGGAAYMDPVNTPPGAVISDDDIKHCLSHSPDIADIMLSHDCPSGIGVPGTEGFEYCGPTGFPKSSLLQDHFSFKTWLFAHHHQSFEHQENGTRYLGLPEAHVGFAVMDETGEVFMVEHQMEFTGRSPENRGLPFSKQLHHQYHYSFH